MKNYKRTILQFTISLILIIVILKWIDLRKVINSLKDANYWYLLLTYLIVTFDRVLMAFKWNLLLKARNIKITLLQATKIYYISSFLGLFLPPTVGGDVVRTYYIVKKKFPIEDVIASILIERLLGFLSLFLFVVLSSYMLIGILGNSYLRATEMLTVILAITIFTCIFFPLSLNTKFTNYIINMLKPLQNIRFWSIFVPKVQKLVISYQSFSINKKILFMFFLLTLIEIFIGVIINFLVAVAFNLSVSFTYFIAFIPVIILFARLPISFDGFGIKEGGTVYFLSFVGVSKAIGFSVGLINHFISLTAVLPGGLFYLLSNREKRIDDVMAAKKKILETKIYGVK